MIYLLRYTSKIKIELIILNMFNELITYIKFSRAILISLLRLNLIFYMKKDMIKSQ